MARRVSFAVAGAIGVAGVALIAQTLRQDADCPKIVRWLQWVVLPIYIVITALAVAPGIVAALGAGRATVPAEGL